MVKTVYEIKTKDWQLSNAKFGEVVENIEDIRQSISNILFTAKGSLPLDATFGTKIHLYVDQPLNRVLPLLTQEIISGIQKYEPRVKIQSVTAYNEGFRLFVKILVTLLVNNSQKELIYDLDKYIGGKDSSAKTRAYSDAYSNAYF